MHGMSERLMLTYVRTHLLVALSYVHRSSTSVATTHENGQFYANACVTNISNNNNEYQENEQCRLEM